MKLCRVTASGGSRSAGHLEGPGGVVMRVNPDHSRVEKMASQAYFIAAATDVRSRPRVLGAADRQSRADTGSVSPSGASFQ